MFAEDSTSRKENPERIGMALATIWEQHSKCPKDLSEVASTTNHQVTSVQGLKTNNCILVSNRNQN